MTEVPIIDQLANRRNNDCGEACAVMLAGAVKPEVVTYAMVDALAARFDPRDIATGPAQLLAMGAAMGVPFAWRADVAYPYITLVSQSRLPAKNNWRPITTIAHWIVRLSDTTYHNPYWPNRRGAYLTATRAELDMAELGARAFVSRLPLPCRVGLANPIAVTMPVHFTEGSPPMKARSRGVNLRTRPIALDAKRAPVNPAEGEATRMRWIAAGVEVDVRAVVNGWANIDLTNNGQVLVTGVALADLLTPLPDKPPPDKDPPPPQLPRTFALGVNVLGNTQGAFEEARLGGRYFLIINDFGGAEALKRQFPDAVVMARRWFPQNFFLTPDQVIEGLEGANHGPIVYTGFNEADQGDHKGKDLIDRARIDIAVARKIKARNPGAVYAAGTFSMGTPDFTNPDVCRIIREEYAPHYNSGLIGFDMHLYSPNMPHIDQADEWQWYERRWEFLFTKCGFDPNVRAIYCGETGIDEGGIGGFLAHGASHAFFREWCAKFITLQSAPMVINGKSYQSPIVGGALFQKGGNGDKRWAGYDVSSYMPVLREFYKPAPRMAFGDMSADMPTGDTPAPGSGEQWQQN